MPRNRVHNSLALAAAGALLVVALPATAIASAPQSLLETKLTGAAEVPGPGDPNGSGQFAAIMTAHTLCYSFAVKKIAPATMAHIHLGKSDVAGPVAVTLTIPTKKGVSACLTAVPDEEDTPVTLGESELAALKRTPGAFYVNAHTGDFPSGAIRGQLAH